jgi:hypothetical protein
MFCFVLVCAPFCLEQSWCLLEQIHNLHHTRSDYDNEKEDNQCLAHWKFFLVFGSLADWDIASFRNVLVKLLTAIANVSWERLRIL